MKKRTLELLSEKSFKYSDTPIFNLVSGKTSCYYVNCKPVILSPEGMYLVGHLMFDAIKESQCTAVGGLTFGADPIAVATAFTSYLKGHPVKAFSIRKVQKDHGMIRWIEGDVEPGEKVVILEDVITTGGSTLKAVQRARDEGLDVIKVISLIDRQEGGLDLIRKEVKDASALITRDDLMAFAGF